MRRRAGDHDGCHLAEVNRFAEFVSEHPRIDTGFGDHSVDEMLVRRGGEQRLGDALSRRRKQRDVFGIGGAHGRFARAQIVYLHRDDVDEAAKGFVIVQHGVLHGDDRSGENPLADRHDLVEVGAFVIQMRDHDAPRHSSSCALMPELNGCGVHATGRGNDESDTVRGVECSAQFSFMFPTTARVEQGDEYTLIAKRHRVELTPMLDCGGISGQCAHQGGLAGLWRSAHRDIAQRTRGACTRHRHGCSLLRVMPRWQMGE